MLLSFLQVIAQHGGMWRQIQNLIFDKIRTCDLQILNPELYFWTTALLKTHRIILVLESSYLQGDGQTNDAFTDIHNKQTVKKGVWYLCYIFINNNRKGWTVISGSSSTETSTTPFKTADVFPNTTLAATVTSMLL